MSFIHSSNPLELDALGRGRVCSWAKPFWSALTHPQPASACHCNDLTPLFRTGVTLSEITSTFTSTFTNADGSVGTSTGTHVTQSAVPVKNNSGSSSTGKTWGIIGGVVGGVVLVAGIVFVAYRLTQRRFSSLDNGAPLSPLLSLTTAHPN